MSENQDARSGNIVPSRQPHGTGRAFPDRGHQVWTLWYPDAAAQGLFVARGRMEGFDVTLAHAVPENVKVEVHDDDGKLIALGENLQSTDDTPISRFTLNDGKINREDIWPGEEDIGRPVILPGGEIGILLKWWNDDDHQEWRWSVEFYNHK